MEIVVIDGQGGGIGKNIIQVLKEKHPEYTIIGVGTNSMATTQLWQKLLEKVKRVNILFLFLNAVLKS